MKGQPGATSKLILDPFQEPLDAMAMLLVVASLGLVMLISDKGGH